jgi:alpha-mannosidase
MGGTWVEPDCNAIGAESLVRQFLLGRTYFRQHFGAQAESPVLWLPDVFGYAWVLPQLIKQAGLDYFFTVKLSWNQYNRIPYDSFWWQGLDGTRVLTHFSTTPENSIASGSTYNAPATPESALGAWNNLQQKELQNEVFMAFGYGDGGGGPTREMLENLREMENFPALPRLRQRSAGDFFVTWSKIPAQTCQPGTVSCIWNTIAAPTPLRAATSAPIAKRVLAARCRIPGQPGRPA